MKFRNCCPGNRRTGPAFGGRERARAVRGSEKVKRADSIYELYKAIQSFHLRLHDGLPQRGEAGIDTIIAVGQCGPDARFQARVIENCPDQNMAVDQQIHRR